MKFFLLLNVVIEGVVVSSTKKGERSKVEEVTSFSVILRVHTELQSKQRNGSYVLDDTKSHYFATAKKHAETNFMSTLHEFNDLPCFKFQFTRGIACDELSLFL